MSNSKPSNKYANSLVSIIMPAFNAAPYISQAITSVTQQTWHNWELLIVDDASCDSTVDIVSKHIKTDSRLHLLRHDKNTGPAIARNTAIKAAKGRYLAFLDSDDLWEANKLKHQIKCMDAKNAPISCAGYLMKSAFSSRTIVPPKNITYHDLLIGNQAGCLTVMLDRSLLIAAHYMRDISMCEDLLLWLDILRQEGISILGIPDILATLRIHDRSLSSQKKRIAGYRWRMYRQELRMGIVHSLYYFSRYCWFGFKKYYLKK